MKGWDKWQNGFEEEKRDSLGDACLSRSQAEAVVWTDTRLRSQEEGRRRGVGKSGGGGGGEISQAAAMATAEEQLQDNGRTVFDARNWALPIILTEEIKSREDGQLHIAQQL